MSNIKLTELKERKDRIPEGNKDLMAISLKGDIVKALFSQPKPSMQKLQDCKRNITLLIELEL